jgi:glycerol-3-phosphate dehydrogenase (NAD(P)+)
MKRVTVMGAGSWGTVFAMILADAGCEVALWARSAHIANEINQDHKNITYHPNLILPDSVRATHNPDEALTDSDLVIIAVPAQTLRENLSAWSLSIPKNAVIGSLIKGIELGTAERMTEVIAEVAKVGTDRVAVISGPNLAHEIAAREPAATTVACLDEESARRIQDSCTTDYFRPYYTTDVVGVEIAGAVKNVIALANGMAVGLGYGENAQAALMTRGLAEMTRLGVALGANPLTFAGLAGVGDLIATCQSPLSRNRTIGEYLGQGLSIKDAKQMTLTTSEGVNSCQSILDLAQLNKVEMPITEQVVNVIHHGRSAHEVLRAFMSRSTKAEEGIEKMEHH